MRLLDAWLSRLRVWAWPRQWTRYVGVPPLLALSVAGFWPVFHWVAVAAVAIPSPLLAAYERDHLRAARAAHRWPARRLSIYGLLALGAVGGLVVSRQPWQVAIVLVFGAALTLATVLGLQPARSDPGQPRRTPA